MAVEFKLSNNFLKEFEGSQPKWGPLGYMVYKRTYSRKDNGHSEEFHQTLQRVVEAAYTIQREHCDKYKLPWNAHKAQKSAQEMYRRMWEFKFLPPGRGLWAMHLPLIRAKGSGALNNCFQYNTEIITSEGIKKIGDLAGSSAELLSENGQWIVAPIKSFGNQTLWKLTLTRSGVEKIIYTTEDHEWFTKDRRNPYRKSNKWIRVKTKDLRPEKHRLRYAFGQGIKNITPSTFGIAHGISFGDGSQVPGQKNSNHIILCGEENACLKKYFNNNESQKSSGLNIKITGLPNYFKKLPNINETKSYLYGWLIGYFAADGNCSSGSPEIDSYNKENILFIREVCSILGIGTYSIISETRKSNLTGRNHTCYSIKLMRQHLSEDFFLLDHHKKSFIKNYTDQYQYWSVKSVEKTNQIEEVFCAIVPEKHAFTLADNILTSNCGFVSTNELDTSFSAPFTYMMDFMMLGVGVGADTEGAGKVTIRPPKLIDGTFVVEDTRESWVSLLEILLESFLGKQLPKLVDFSRIRAEGEPIKTFGGTSSGPGPLKALVDDVIKVLCKTDNRFKENYPKEDVMDISSLIKEFEPYEISSTQIVDIFNLIGRCVVAGNTRRSAELMIGSPFDNEFIKLKQNEYKLSHHRWASNNSIAAKVGIDYSVFAQDTAVNGEPGYVWLDNARRYGRLKDGENWKDRRVMGFNPCYAKDTLIAVADGRNAVSIEQLAKEEKDVPVYSLNKTTGLISIKMGRNPRITGTAQKLIRVHLTDDNYFDVTPNHKFIKKDGVEVEAKDLQPGDSLSPFKKRLAKTSKDSKLYYLLHLDANNPKNSRIFEHRIITKYFYPEEWNQKYKKEQENGWIKGGLAVHHKDYDSLNNSPENLEIMSFKEHTKLHAQVDTQGSKNGRFSGYSNDDLKKYALELTKSLGRKFSVKEWNQFAKEIGIPSQFSKFRRDSLGSEKQLALWAANECGFENQDLDPRTLRLYQKALEQGYTAKIEDEKVFVERACEICKNNFYINYQSREQAFCSTACSNKYLNSKENAIVYQKRFKRQKEVLRKNIEKTKIEQLRVYSDLKYKLQKDPLKTEWESECKKQKVPIRFAGSKNSFKEYKELKQAAENYNARVKSIEYLDGLHTVYNITVDDNHTVAIVNQKKHDSGNYEYTGINVANCGEQSLESFELCNLVEVMLPNHSSYEDLETTLKYAYLYAKTVTLIPTHDERVNAVMMRNRRIGTSLTGITQAFRKFGKRKTLGWADEGYEYLKSLDKQYSDWLCIPRSIKLSTVKPSGTVSLLPGVTPGIHYPHSEYYIRNVRIASNNPLVKVYENAGYPVEADIYSPGTSVISFPIKEDNFIKGKDEITIWEQLENAAQMQYYWSDNSVSITVTFKPQEAKEINEALQLYETRLKSVSFLPILEHGYKQAPYITITEEEYNKMLKKLKIAPIKPIAEDVGKSENLYCESDSCELPEIKK